MYHIVKRAFRDIAANGFINSVMIVTVALSILIVGAFALLWINANAVMEAWTSGIRIMAYLSADVAEDEVREMREKIGAMSGVGQVVFIPKDEAFEKLKAQLEGRSSLLNSLSENPLPDAFEIGMDKNFRNYEGIEKIASRVEAMAKVSEVEYGRKWLGRFTHIFDLFKLTAYAMGCLFFMAAVFFVSNTLRLVLYSRRDEVGIMRLVGATDAFIKMPFYIQSVLQCAIGGIVGLSVLFAGYRFASANIGPDLVEGFFQIRFLTPETIASIIGGSIFIGWLGCCISLRQFLRY